MWQTIYSLVSFSVYLMIMAVADRLFDFRSLKRELIRAQEEIKRIQSVPLVIGQFMEAIDQKYVLSEKNTWKM